MSHYEAFLNGLLLAVTAPTDDKAQEVAEMCEVIASHLSEHEIKRAQREAEQLIREAHQ
jgi:hypothetical protein